MKIVINNCYGGFSLSKEACDFLGITFEESSEYYKDYKRTDPKLIKCVEKLGEIANGDCNAELVIVEIPDQIKYGIFEVYGIEYVYEQGHIWAGPDQDL